MVWLERKKILVVDDEEIITREQMIESARYCMVHGKPGGGYIFSTSNVVFKGMPLENYYLILEVWKQYRDYC